MTTDNFCFYLQNRLIQTSQTEGQWYCDTPPLVFPVMAIIANRQGFGFSIKKLPDVNSADSLTKITKYILENI
jgi:hypothetical protein